MATKNKIIVIGLGHAGIEAACIAAKLGSDVVAITLNKNKIGFMPCNPSIGGSAKGTTVREIDALGGMMGIVADATALQSKLLNISGGLAVQSLRVQSDIKKYPQYMQKSIFEHKNIKIVEGEVDEFILERLKSNWIIKGVRLKNGSFLYADAVILTTGTYLKPLTHRGKEIRVEGPAGENKVINKISEQLKNIGFRFRRLKTGTSPRCIKNSIDYSKLKEEPGTDLPLRFSYRTDVSQLLPFKKQLPCYLFRIEKPTIDIIKKNLHLSSIFFLEDLGIVGPRRCPSIDAQAHYYNKEEQGFIEPLTEDVGGEEMVYLQGFSTSLPIDIQLEALRKISGFENIKIAKNKEGYFIEYDSIDASEELKNTLETKKIKNLFTAGQINGTTGYEEAAAQGLIAGVNAHQKINNLPSLIIYPHQAYIGVMIWDLINKKNEEPYRLLISRAAHRLSLRHDNADTRLYPITKQLGLLADEQWKEFLFKQKKQALIVKKLHELKFSFSDLKNNFSFVYDIDKWKNVNSISAYNFLKGSKVDLKQFIFLIPEIKELNFDAQRECEANIKYEGYFQRELKNIENQIKHESMIIPDDINYKEIYNLSLEEIEKLNKKKPTTIKQAMDIAGINPTGIQVLINHLNRLNKLKNYSRI